MKKYITTIVLVLCALTMTAQDLFKDVLYPVETVLKFCEEIGLTETKVTAIKKIYDDNSPVFNSLKWDLDAAQVAIRKKLEASKIDETSTLEQLKKINVMEDELKYLRLKMLIKIKNELSEEQQEKLNALISGPNSKGWNVTTGVGNDPKIVLKGATSFSEGAPLYVLIKDGAEFRTKSDEMEKIDPNKIESISVLKGDAAKSQYGKDGKNGVIIIKIKD